jgi:hypothetical protein
MLTSNCVIFTLKLRLLLNTEGADNLDWRLLSCDTSTPRGPYSPPDNSGEPTATLILLIPKPLHPLTFLAKLFKSQNSSSCAAVSCMRFIHLRRNGSVNTVIRQRTGRTRTPSSIPGKRNPFSVLQTYRPALEPTQPPSRWVMFAAFPRINRPEA